MKKYNIRFPAEDIHQLGQDEAYFHLSENGDDLKIRFHDYADIYTRPGLYEQLFYERLKCTSPQKAYDILAKVLEENRIEMTEIRLLDVGAGNGMVGELIHAARAIGVDICTEARDACERDRPGIYDDYLVIDLCNMDNDTENKLKEWNLDAMTCIAALGFGDIPTEAFVAGFNVIQNDGWLCFNIKETFLQESDNSGFSSLIKKLLVTDILEIHHMERYRHRISIDGRPLFYYMIVGRKQGVISPELVG